MNRQPLRNLRKMIFPNERSYHAFKLTGSAWTTLAMVIMAALAVFWSTSSNAETSQPDFLIEGSGKVVHVIDGDTVIVQSFSTPNTYQLYDLAMMYVEHDQTGTDASSVDNRFNLDKSTFTARIGNINTAESVHPDPTRNTLSGERASAAAKQLIDQRFVDYQCYDIGYYARPICSLQTGDFDFALEMIRLGHSQYVQKYGNHPLDHQSYLQAAQQSP